MPIVGVSEETCPFLGLPTSSLRLMDYAAPEAPKRWSPDLMSNHLVHWRARWECSGCDSGSAFQCRIASIRGSRCHVLVLRILDFGCASTAALHDGSHSLLDAGRAERADLIPRRRACLKEYGCQYCETDRRLDPSASDLGMRKESISHVVRVSIFSRLSPLRPCSLLECSLLVLDP